MIPNPLIRRDLFVSKLRIHQHHILDDLTFYQTGNPTF